MMGTALLCLVVAFFVGGVLVWLAESLYSFFSTWLSNEDTSSGAIVWGFLSMVYLLVLFGPIVGLNVWVVKWRHKGFSLGDATDDDLALTLMLMGASGFGVVAAVILFGQEFTHRVGEILPDEGVFTILEPSTVVALVSTIFSLHVSL